MNFNYISELVAKSKKDKIGYYINIKSVLKNK